MLALLLTACAPESGGTTTTTTMPGAGFVGSGSFDGGYPPPPEVPAAPLAEAIDEEVGSLVASIEDGGFDDEAVEAIAAGGDPRVTWFLADLLRFFQGGDNGGRLQNAFARLTGVTLDTAGSPAFVDAFNHLIAWDLPAWDGYEARKGDLYTILEPGWEPFFEENVSIDWRWVTWGGVLIDDRPLGDPNPCVQGCIPALDDPATVAGSDVDWLSDDFVVFGIVHNGEALALPRNQMEVHEMVNLTLGGDRLGIPYCTLCGSAQAYLTGSVPDEFEAVVLRTSGLLSRSNKVMYDLNTKSVFDTFTGEALSGPMGRAGVVLDQVSVVTSTWGAWLDAHPDTRVIAEDGGLGRTYADAPLGDRDAGGPIFPVGPVDPRLGVHEKVLGVIAADGTALAFPIARLDEAVEAGGEVAYGDLLVVRDGGGFRVTGPNGEIPAHEAFWFAWSQFHPGTLLWSGEG